MATDTLFRCFDCNMNFNSPSQLNRHRTKFCIGKSGDSKLLTHRSLRSPGDGYGRDRWTPDDDDRPNTGDTYADDKDEYSPRQPDYRKRETNQQLRLLAENHGRNLADIQARNRELERQREDIKRRLDELNRKNMLSPQVDPTSRTIEELKQKEAENQKTLDELKNKLDQMSNEGRDRLVPLPYDGNSLVAEISVMRQAYLQKGGSDPNVLAQFASMQAEAMSLEAKRQKPEKSKPKAKPKSESLQDQILAFELENQRLQRDLLILQQRNMNNLSHKRSSEEEEVMMERELKQLQREHMKKLTQLQHEMELVKQKAELEKYRRDIYDAQKPPPQPAPAPAPPPPPQPHQGDMPALVQRSYPNPAEMYAEPLPAAPYDPNAGFVIFYDFILGLDPSIHTVRLVSGLYNNVAELGEPTILPAVYCEQATPAAPYAPTSNVALIGAKQPVPRCPPAMDMALVVEVQLSTDSQHLSTQAWCKMDMFDDRLRVISGRWKVPLRTTPIKPNLPAADLNSIPQFGTAELYYRVVNYRDADAESLFNLTPGNTNLYRHPAQASSNAPHYEAKFSHQPPPPPSDTPPVTPIKEGSSVNRYSPLSDRPPVVMDMDNAIGFQVDRVKNAEAGEGKVRLTAYHANTKRPVQSSTTPVTCSTTAVKSNYKHNYHIYGQQEATFDGVEMTPDMILIVRFYLRQRLAYIVDEYDAPPAADLKLYDDESLVAWAALPLMVPRSLKNDPSQLHRMASMDISKMRVNTGTHIIRLYQPPVPEPDKIPLSEHWRPKDWQRYGKATVRLHVFSGKPRPGSLTPSEGSGEEESSPELAWLPYQRLTPPTDPYNASDGFDLYIDGCRFLPDAVTVTRIAGRVLDRKYQKIGKDINTSVKLDSDIFNPVYNYRSEFREPHIPPSSTLLLKVYTIDRFTQKLTVVGYATLNVFVETGVDKQPSTDQGGVQVSLNEGAHQLRLHHQGPNGVDPLTESCLRDSGQRTIPCASILVRLLKAPIGPTGRPLEADKVPQVDWARMGLWVSRPSYSDRMYFSIMCTPTRGENQLFKAMMKRNVITMREAIQLMAGDEAKRLRTDRSMEQFIRTQLTKLMDVTPLELDMNFITKYSPIDGIKVAVDSAMNLPWTNFTHAHFCLNPPGAFYQGHPFASYDKLTFTQKLDIHSSNKSPVWRDGFLHYPNRSFHRYLALIIHLEEISVNITKDNYKYGLMEQAWAPIQIFTEGYANTHVYQVPLIQGAPNEHMLRQLTREPCAEWVSRAVRNGTIQLADSASVFVRIADARRDEELPDNLPDNHPVELNTEYIPVEKADSYQSEQEGRPLQTMIPQGKIPKEFIDSLATKFKSLVYKLYEEQDKMK